MNALDQTHRTLRRALVRGEISLAAAKEGLQEAFEVSLANAERLPASIERQLRRRNQGEIDRDRLGPE